MKKVAILMVLAFAGALVGIACGGESAAPPKDPTSTSSSGGPAGSDAPAASAAPAAS